MRLTERVARVLITLGGLGTIVAVSLILGFLLWVVVPLFLPAAVSAGETASLGNVESGDEALVLRTDEDQLLAVFLDADGVLRIHDRSDGSLLEKRVLFGGARPTCSSTTVGSDAIAFGFADGTARLGTLSFTVEFLPDDDLPAELADLSDGERRPWAGGIADRVRGHVRVHRVEVALEEPLSLSDRPLRALDVASAAGKTVLCVLDDGGAASLVRTRRKRNLLTGAVTLKADRYPLPTEELSAGAPPRDVFVFGAGHDVLFVWDDGHAVRIDARDARAPRVAEKLDLTQPGSQVTVTRFLLGRSTLLVGDSRGRVRAWFLTKPETAGTLDGTVLSPAHELVSDTTSPVTSIAPSPRSRLAAVGHADGSVHVFNVTSQDEIGVATPLTTAPVKALAFAPKEDGLLASAGAVLASWRVVPRHPEASPTALFRPLWYEGYVSPEYVWQSSGGTDDFEPKLSLVPLVFGTLKATLYSMLFGAPIALLAAIYTSEFLDPKRRARTKATIEMMASLPSVVLGFIGALVLAPFLQRWLPETLALLFTLPFTVVLGAHLWQLLPRRVALRLRGGPRLLAIFSTLPLGVLAARVCGRPLEGLLFAGDVQHWLDGQAGGSIGGWLFLLLPLSTLLVAFLNGRFAAPWARTRTLSWDHGRCARFALARFVVGSLLVLALALALSAALDLAGLDPRGSFLGTYVQRNALVVGFVMGFAVVPIIYTLSEDALQSVPGHLRFASLGAGATPWQTAVRVIVPTAMSGLFSAVMIGLGRAVGETMIVLMATGNTPIMDWNVFNGFRTLSANIAYELPEAVQNSTHYRVLFLAALVLFLLTFLLNTVAEVVRQRFRKRAFQL